VDPSVDHRCIVDCSKADRVTVRRTAPVVHSNANFMFRFVETLGFTKHVRATQALDGTRNAMFYAQF